MPTSVRAYIARWVFLFQQVTSGLWRATVGKTNGARANVVGLRCICDVRQGSCARSKRCRFAVANAIANNIAATCLDGRKHKLVRGVVLVVRQQRLSANGIDKRQHNRCGLKRVMGVCDRAFNDDGLYTIGDRHRYHGDGRLQQLARVLVRKTSFCDVSRCPPFDDYRPRVVGHATCVEPNPKPDRGGSF